MYTGLAGEVVAVAAAVGVRLESFDVEIRSQCACCGEKLRLTVSTAMECRVHDDGAAPLVFEPDVDWATFTDPSIIHRY